ncbi:MAG: rhomboid family intramembrane serine protease [Cytophagaceae bacterium]|jgi:membrane associated rhomboid family serine protease|nr:rhomboid family intramembrane serine protease [Cytophagaceae bacterium]
MFQSIWADIKFEYSKKGNYLIRLILINIAVFLFLSICWFVSRFASFDIFSWLLHWVFSMPTPMPELMYRPWTFVITFFTHYDFFHILTNMLGLYWFGRIVEDLVGNKKLLALYLLGGLASSLLVIALYNTVPYFVNMPSTVVGASGAVFAIAVAAATLAPNYSLYLMLIGPVRIKYIVAVYIFLSLLGIAGSNAGGNVAHLGGTLFGFFYVAMLRNGNDLGKPVYWIMSWWEPKPKMKTTYRNKNTIKYTNESPDQDEIDRILDKINRSGYESLSKEEKQKLFKASQNQ